MGQTLSHDHRQKWVFVVLNINWRYVQRKNVVNNVDMSQYHVEHQDATDKNKNSMLTSFTHIACIQQIMTYVHININVCSYSTLIIREIVKI